MDIVYVNRDGENPELRYSLRSLENVEYEAVWVFGGSPVWLNPVTVNIRERRQRPSAYLSTRDHIAAACNTADVSDPFLLWNDDFFAMKMVGEVPIMHRGSLADMVAEFSGVKTPWAKGLIETAHVLSQTDDVVDPVSYDLHVPLIIHKAPMRAALRMADKMRSDAAHLRTIYGNLCLDASTGVKITDPKMKRKSDPFPQGRWLSSGDDTFRAAVEPVLRYLFPNPSIYEKG